MAHLVALGEFWWIIAMFYVLEKPLDFKISLFPIRLKHPKPHGLQINGKNRVLELPLLGKDL